MKNIQVIDGALNAVYDIFQATDEEFSLIFAHGEDIAFIDEVIVRGVRTELDAVFTRIWKRRIPKARAMGCESRWHRAAFRSGLRLTWTK
jgi:hypothetical protein